MVPYRPGSELAFLSGVSAEGAGVFFLFLLQQSAFVHPLAQPLLHCFHCYTYLRSKTSVAAKYCKSGIFELLLCVRLTEFPSLTCEAQNRSLKLRNPLKSVIMQNSFFKWLEIMVLIGCSG